MVLSRGNRVFPQQNHDYTYQNTPSSVGPRRIRAALISVILWPAAVLAQTTPPASSPPPTATVETTSTPPASQTVQLDPFEVSATPDKSYGELNSNSITAFKTELDKMPVSADVFDQTFMDDTGTQSVEEMLQQYSAGAGSASSQPDTSAANGQYLDRNANGSFPFADCRRRRS